MDSRIKLTDSLPDVIKKMADGNIGAVTTMMELFKAGMVEPYNPLEGLHYILLLDTFQIYGTDIYVLHSDICERDVAKTIAVLRTTQMGMFSQNVLKDACSRQDYSGKKLVPVDELYAKMKEKFPAFNSQLTEAP